MDAKAHPVAADHPVVPDDESVREVGVHPVAAPDERRVLHDDPRAHHHHAHEAVGPLLASDDGDVLHDGVLAPAHDDAVRGGIDGDVPDQRPVGRVECDASVTVSVAELDPVVPLVGPVGRDVLGRERAADARDSEVRDCHARRCRGHDGPGSVASEVGRVPGTAERQGLVDGEGVVGRAVGVVGAGRDPNRGVRRGRIDRRREGRRVLADDHRDRPVEKSVGVGDSLVGPLMSLADRGPERLAGRGPGSEVGRSNRLPPAEFAAVLGGELRGGRPGREGDDRFARRGSRSAPDDEVGVLGRDPPDVRRWGVGFPEVAVVADFQPGVGVVADVHRQRDAELSGVALAREFVNQRGDAVVAHDVAILGVEHFGARNLDAALAGLDGGGGGHPHVDGVLEGDRFGAARAHVHRERGATHQQEGEQDREDVFRIHLVGDLRGEGTAGIVSDAHVYPLSPVFTFRETDEEV